MFQQRFVLLICFVCTLLNAQTKLVLPEKSKGKVAFESKSNLMVITISIEGVEMNFLVDTGVGRTLIFDTHKAKQLGFEHDRPIFLRGLGDQPALEAYRVDLPRIDIADFYLENVDALVLPENEFILSKRFGMHIDGIIGHDMFAHFPVSIDYSKRIIQINPQKKLARWSREKTATFPFWSRKKTIVLPLSIHQLKPYVFLSIPNKEPLDLEGKFLLDTGLSDALWLFSNEFELVKNPPVFEDFLGTGINGEVYGHRGKIPYFNFGQVRLKHVKVAYPAEHSFQGLTLQEQRIGSVGAELMSRFKLIFDYPNKRLLMKTTHKTRAPFYYNLSGIELAYDGVQMIRQRLPNVKRKGATGNNGIEILLQNRFQFNFYPVLTITYVRPNSAASQAGIKAGDVLLQINGRRVHTMSLEKVLQHLQKKPGEKIRLTVKRNNHQRKFSFFLSSIFPN